MLAIVVVAAALRFFNIGSDGLIGDEPAYSVRSIDYIDTLGTPAQTTPLDWFESQPWWQKLSFHDHPPLVFMLQHAGHAVLGPGIEAARAVSALFDVGSVVVLFMLGSLLWSTRAGLIGASLWAVNDFALTYARSSMMESIALFFSLLSIWFFLKSIDHKKYILYFGAAFGLATLAKYTALFMLPVFAYVAYRKKVRCWGAITPFLLVISPLLIYNTMLYKTVGHFDVQISTLFGQQTQWLDLLGKNQRGTALERLYDLKNIFYYVSPLLFVLLLQAIGFFFVEKERKNHFGWRFMVLSLLTSVIFVWYADTAGRFFFYSLPFVVLVVSAFVAKAKRRWLAPAVIVFELVFALNSVFGSALGGPYGSASLTYASAVQRHDYGIFSLDSYLQETVDGFSSALMPFNVSQSVLDRIDKNRSTSAKNNQWNIFVYDDALPYQTYFWVLYKRTLSDGWPLMSSSQWENAALDQELKKLLLDKGVVTYIHTLESTKQNENAPTEFSKQLRARFLDVQIKPEIIKTNAGLPAFEVYSAPYQDVYGQ